MNQDETLDELEARPLGTRPGPRRSQRARERWRRIAEASLPCVISHGGYSFTQHSHDRENARRRRLLAATIGVPNG
jgi:hypothetical protein